MKKWLKLGDEMLGEAKLARLANYYQHLFGLCSRGITIKKVTGYGNCQLETGVNERHWIISAQNERSLIHEMLHLLFYERCREDTIFSITNAILQLRYRNQEVGK